MPSNLGLLTINILIAVFLIPGLGDVGSIMRKGNSLIRQEKFDEALETYQKAQVLEPDNLKIRYNLGRALYKLQKYPEAMSEFEIGLLSKDKKFQANTFYNMGNCNYKQGNLEGAINAYKRALLLNPRDKMAKENLEFCLKMKEQLKSQQKEDSTKEKQKQQPKPKPNIQNEQIPKEEADRILEALKNREREKRKKQPPSSKEKVEKDW